MSDVLDQHLAGHVLGGLRMRTVEDAEVGPAVEMDLRPEVANPHGSLHGGLMTALIECGAAAIAVRAGGSTDIVASDIVTRFLSSVRVGPARVVGRALHVGRRSIVVQADVVDVGDQRRLVATSTVSYARLGGVADADADAGAPA